MLSRLSRRTLAALALAMSTAACTAGGAPETAGPRVGDWAAVSQEARGQTVNWYMYGGDPAMNAFVNGYVADRLSERGITLRQVKVADTAQALDTMLGEQQAGLESGGSVDLVWINGENFATGRQAELWACGWASQLPNSRHLDLDDPALRLDFGVPVNGCEAAWQQANSALVYDSDALGADDARSVASLVAWARANPGRFTYPAPPDFTGSMVVRTLLYDQLGGPERLLGTFDQAAYDEVTPPLWASLNALESSLWRAGETYPRTQAEVEKMYGDNQLDAYFTYGPGAVSDRVRDGVYPASTRIAVPSGGNLANTSFVALPANASDREGALVLANLVQSPEAQLEMYRQTGAYPVLDATAVSPQVRRRLERLPAGPAAIDLATLTSHTQPELSADYVTQLERDWTTHVLQQ